MLVLNHSVTAEHSETNGGLKHEQGQPHSGVQLGEQKFGESQQPLGPRGRPYVEPTGPNSPETWQLKKQPSSLFTPLHALSSTSRPSLGITLPSLRLQGKLLSFSTPESPTPPFLLDD